MCENENPKVIVDDDFLDLRNTSGKPSRKRPTSAQSIKSSSVNTHGNASSVKDVLPGLQRFLTSYGHRKSNSFGYKKNNKVNSQPVDCRFRRRVEKKALSSRSASILQENEEQNKETSTSSSVVTTRNHSSESGKQDEDTELPSTLSQVNQKNDKVSKIKSDDEFKKKERIEKGKEKSKEKTNYAIEETKKAFEKRMKKTETPMKKNSEIKEKVEEDLCRKRIITDDKGKIEWEDSRIHPSRGYQLPLTFKKSWTVPSLPLVKKTFPWTRNYNALCAKVDRKTYEFDTDDTISDSEENLSAYSTISRSNYMNLIFCLGCLCGIFLIGGILTASEIQADYFRATEADVGMMEFLFGQVSYTLRVIFSVFQQILTLPSSKLMRSNVEPSGHWSFLNKYLYFTPE